MTVNQTTTLATLTVNEQTVELAVEGKDRVLMGGPHGPGSATGFQSPAALSPISGHKAVQINAAAQLVVATPTTLAAVGVIRDAVGAADSGKIVALDGDGLIAMNMMPNGLGAHTVTKNASENLGAGDLVSLWNDGGTVKVRKADGTTNKPAHGFVVGAVTSGAAAEVRLEGTITGLSGLTLGRRWLSTTAGASTSTAPSASGNIIQSVGFAVSATELIFRPGEECLIG